MVVSYLSIHQWSAYVQSILGNWLTDIWRICWQSICSQLIYLYSIYLIIKKIVNDQLYKLSVDLSIIELWIIDLLVTMIYWYLIDLLTIDFYTIDLSIIHLFNYKNNLLNNNCMAYQTFCCFFKASMFNSFGFW